MLKRRIITLLSFIAFMASIYLVAAPYFAYTWLTTRRRVDRVRKIRDFLYRANRVVLRSLPGVEVEFDTQGQQFDTPSVVVSNHQSLLDFMCILSLSPRVVILTNDYGWNNPFIGWVIRCSGSLSVGRGVDDLMPRLAEIIEQGYSIAIFPEGTRSVTGDILRFHTGAFLVADRLALDIKPIVIKGSGAVMKRRATVFYPGKIKVTVMPSVRFINPDETLRQRARSLRERYKDWNNE